MELKDILSISGAPGLYKYVAQGKGGIIVESVSDSRRQLVGGSAKVSALGDIAIFTDADEVALAQVLQSVCDLQKGAALAINNKSDNDTLATFMAEVLPNYDRERVHVSDIKKLASWYNILIGAGFTQFISEQTEAEQDSEEAVAETEDSVAKKAKNVKTTAADQSAKKQAVKNVKPKSSASQPKIVATKTATNRKSS